MRGDQSASSKTYKIGITILCTQTLVVLKERPYIDLVQAWSLAQQAACLFIYIAHLSIRLCLPVFPPLQFDFHCFFSPTTLLSMSALLQISKSTGVLILISMYITSIYFSLFASGAHACP